MKSEKFVNEVFNIGSDIIITIKELAETIIRLTSSKSKIVHLPALPDGDMTRRQPDNTKMKQLLNRDLVPLERGILNVLEAIK
jgi:UDP-glucose 4-epimerase